jgi:glycosyltransferase involved in cell wall biosynthesis
MNMPGPFEEGSTTDYGCANDYFFPILSPQFDKATRIEGLVDHVSATGQACKKLNFANSKIPDSCASRDWNELRAIYSQHRAYLNLNREPEKGYNSAMLEAMASGMPVISLKHPSTIIRNGENGFLVENASEAVERGRQLLADHELAQRLGRCARDTIDREFSMKLFRERWNELLARSIKPGPNADGP